MNQDKSKEAEKPEFWMSDYFNAWASAGLDIEDVKCGAMDASTLWHNPIQIFEEYIADRVYYGKKCPLSKIPKKFIVQTNRLAKLYNSLIDQNEVSISKLERVLFLVNRIIC